ncbi:MAG: class I SAM-dependent methyltransferase [Nitrospiraceae bacterium]|nr:class I SAM-dependent methyltransferase [Nitrospiraceae bacterium]
MDELEKEYLISHYSKLMGTLGETPAALGWTKAGQIERYNAVLRMKGLSDGSSVLDFGCGMGDLYPFLGERFPRLDFTGLDINPKLVSIAQRRYQTDGNACRFGVFDSGKDQFARSYDFSVICGVFNQRLEHAVESAKNAVRKVWDVTKKALFFDALSDSAPAKDFTLQYYNLSEMRDFARTLSGDFEISGGIVNGDIILYLYRSN